MGRHDPDEDTDNEKNNDDELVNALFNVKKSKRFGEKIAGLSTFGNFEAVDEGAEAPADTLKETEPKLITHSEFKKLFEVTKTMKEDLQFDIVATKAAAYVRAYKRSADQRRQDLYLRQQDRTGQHHR